LEIKTNLKEGALGFSNVFPAMGSAIGAFGIVYLADRLFDFKRRK
jgi:hypothetical protein